jgi:hypothetical protein
MSYYVNISKIYKQCDIAELHHGITWYNDAKKECQNIADRYEQNIKDGDNMCRIFTDGGYVEDCKPCTYKTMRDKAWSILQSMPHNDDDVAFILRGPKITDFFYCIMGRDVCVIDGHAWCIANNDRRTMQEVPNIGKKLRTDLQKAYSKAGKKYNMTAFQMQAATWVAWRRIHGVA